MNGEASAPVFPCLAVVTVWWRPGEATSPKATPQHLLGPLHPSIPQTYDP